MSEQETEPEEGEQPDAGAERAALVSFERCCSCRHATQKNMDQGTLVCKKHNMLINATDDEIPDDCKEYEK